MSETDASPGRTGAATIEPRLAINVVATGDVATVIAFPLYLVTRLRRKRTLFLGELGAILS